MSVFVCCGRGERVGGSASSRVDRTPLSAGMTPMYGMRNQMYGMQTPLHDGSRTPHFGNQTPSHEAGGGTPGRSAAWDPANPNTPSRYVILDSDHQKNSHFYYMSRGL